MIGVVGDDGTDVLAERLRAAGGSVEAGSAEQVVEDGPDVIVAVGEGALVDLVRAGVDAPVLPVGEVSGLPSVSFDDTPKVSDQLVAEDYVTRDYRLLAATADGRSVGPALFEAMLVRAEPGRISEFGLAADGTSARFRADGVVVATPAGSHGYAAAAGGPRLAPDSAAIAVVPVAAFGLGAPTWVFDDDGEVRLSVERDEGEVAVLVDGHERRRLTGRSSVVLTGGEPLRVVEISAR